MVKQQMDDSSSTNNKWDYLQQVDELDFDYLMSCVHNHHHHDGSSSSTNSSLVFQASQKQRSKRPMTTKQEVSKRMKKSSSINDPMIIDDDDDEGDVLMTDNEEEEEEEDVICLDDDDDDEFGDLENDDDGLWNAENDFDFDKQSETMVEIAIQLIRRVALLQEKMNMGVDENRCRDQILQILKFLSELEPHPKITQHYVQLLDVLDDKKPIIERIPDICGETFNEAESIIEQLSQCMMTDRTLCTSVVGVLYELPNLTNEQKKKIGSITISSLDYVEEEDVVVLIRTLLKTITRESAPRIVDSIRQVCRTLPAHICSLICAEVLITTFSVNPIAVKNFIDSIKKPSIIPLSRFDILVILVLLHTHQRDRRVVFSILRQTYQSKPVQLLTLSNIQEAIASDYHSLSNSRILSNSVFAMATYFLHQKNVFKEEEEPWCHSICILVFKLYRDKRAHMISSLLASLQTVEIVSSNDIGYSSDACVSGDILVSLASDEQVILDDISSPCKILSEFSGMIEDGLMRAKKISVRSIHSLCFVLCRCIAYQAKILPNLMMFLRKQLFSAHELQTQMGLIAASHILYVIGCGSDHFRAEYKDEFTTVLEWVLQTFQSTEIDHKTIYLLDLVQLNMELIDNDSLEHLFDHYIEPLMNHVGIMSKKQGKNEISFEFDSSTTHFLKVNNPSGCMTLLSLQVYYQLMSSYVQILQRTRPSTTTLDVYKCGYQIKQNSLPNMLMALMISTSLTQSMITYTQNLNRSMNTEEEKLLDHLIKTLLCFRDRVHSLCISSKLNEQTKNVVKGVLIRYQVSFKTISAFMLKLFSDKPETDVQQRSAIELNETKLRITTLSLLWSSLASFNVQHSNDDVVIVNSIKKEKGIARTNAIDLIKNKSHFHRHIFGAFSHSTRYEGTAAEMMDIIGESVKLMLSQSTSLIERLVESRAQVSTPNEDKSKKHAEDQDYIFVTLCFFYHIISRVIHLCKQTTPLFERLVKNWSAITTSNTLDTHHDRLQAILEHLLDQFCKCQEYHLSHLISQCLFTLANETQQQIIVGYLYRYIMCTIYPAHRGISDSSTAMACYMISNSIVLRSYPFDMLVKERYHSELIDTIPTMAGELQQTITKKMQNYVLQLQLLMPMIGMKAQDCLLYFYDLTIAMNDLVLALNGTVKSEKLISLQRREHLRYRMLNESTFPKLLTVLLPVHVRAIQTSPTVANHVNKRFPFKHFQSSVDNMKHILQIVIQAIPCSSLRLGINKMYVSFRLHLFVASLDNFTDIDNSTTSSMNACLEIIEALKVKLNECLRYRTDPFFENLEPHQFVTLFKSLNRFVRACISFCKILKLTQEKRKFSSSENKRRELVVKLFFSSTKLDEYMETIKQSHHIYPKNNGEDEIDDDEDENEDEDEDRYDIDEDFEDDISSDEDGVEPDDDSFMQKWAVHESERIVASNGISSWTNAFQKQFVIEDTESRDYVLSEYKKLWSSFTDQTLLSQLLYQVDKILSEEAVELQEERPQAANDNPSPQDSESEEEDDGFCMRKVQYDEHGKRIV